MTGVSRHKFLFGAAALAAEVTVLASCGSRGGSETNRAPTPDDVWRRPRL